MNTIKSLAILCVSAVVVAGGIACASRGDMHEEHMMTALTGILDGKTYVGDVGKMGESPSRSETITFMAGYFHSSACDEFHFNKAPYLAVASAGATDFMAITHNREHSMIVWKGTVKGDMLEATMTLYEKGKPPDERWVKAKAQ